MTAVRDHTKSVSHYVGVYTLHNELHSVYNTEEQWEALLSSWAFEDRLCLVQRAKMMAMASGALE